MSASSDWWISREERGHFHVWIISLLSTLSQPQEQSTRIIRGGGKVNDLHRVFCFETFAWWTAAQAAPSEHYILHFVNCNVKFARGSAVAPESWIKSVWWYISPFTYSLGLVSRVFYCILSLKLVSRENSTVFPLSNLYVEYSTVFPLFRDNAHHHLPLPHRCNDPVEEAQKQREQSLKQLVHFLFQAY